jgi:hypothetical protein
VKYFTVAISKNLLRTQGILNARNNSYRTSDE